MLKVYAFCLSTILIIDTNKNVMFFSYAGNIPKEGSETKAREKSSRITKATINKHIKNYKKFVVGIPILNEYAPAYVGKYDKLKDFIGAFADWTALQGFIEALDTVSKPFFDGNLHGNYWTTIIEIYVKFRRGLSDWEKEQQLKHLADEKCSLHKDVKRENMLFDSLEVAKPVFAEFLQK